MSAKVVVKPSGNEFFAGPHDTLLEAGLRSGLNLDYACPSGSCGDCRARVVSGEVGEVGFHDFRFSSREKTRVIS